ncbi:MAG: hypothetical protein ABH847_00315 [Candidatus Omnitrophota bacterium]
MAKGQTRTYFILAWIIFLALFTLPGCASLIRKKEVVVVPPHIVVADRKAQRVYDWVKGLQLPNGLLESSDGSNFVSLYENALSAVVFCAYGDFDRAEKIFDFFDQHIDELRQSPGGFGQFRDRQGIPLDGTPHRWLGDNAWLLIALNNYHHLTNTRKYEALSLSLETWLRSLQDEADGGLWGGYDKQGQKILKSTEGTIDVFNAVSGYDSFHKKILQYLKHEYWDAEKKTFLAWKEHPTYKYALDLHSWGYCAFKKMPIQILEEADSYRTTKIALVNNKNITGFCFDLDLDSIWLEGTGEMVVAYRSAGLNFMAEYYLRELEKMFVPSSKDPQLYGIPYATNPGTHYGRGQLWEGVERYLSLASSAWYLLGKFGYDPMKIGRDKDISDEDLFWLKTDK